MASNGASRFSFKVDQLPFQLLPGFRRRVYNNGGPFCNLRAADADIPFIGTIADTRTVPTTDSIPVKHIYFSRCRHGTELDAFMVANSAHSIGVDRDTMSSRHCQLQLKLRMLITPPHLQPGQR
ncbi:hypothetical protein HBH98_182630 [Parastagonospora nodorum]|nr:hypothetical protein HBH53_231080 [Parastagonospora nodorum]KAH3956679.1 hypothetical protein HBH51_237470 [Parastagonospora nodorum]KAH4215694.1 hypothetical protein HBI06_244240 [Parastagonospora nodorum]KAH4224460.1 hypothetical protein HBI05_236500 [Parastagonospora nodorum]KAH4341263.1 hypothetical protein HBH98_182630 [Parastagonospora nodorum]